MTSASELFHTRRHRLGQNALDLTDSELQVADSFRRHHHHTRRLIHRSERDGINRRYRWLRTPVNDSVDYEENVRGSLGGSASERLPAGVILARARLLQRLRGEPLSRNRQHVRDLLDEDQESEPPNEVANGTTLVTDLTYQMERSQFLQELNKKPPGLTQEALDCLDQEVFSSSETGLESRVMQDCGICLETFTDGDELIRLPCGHKFHSVCLDPWIRCCGDCPYCRRSVVVNTHLP